MSFQAPDTDSDPSEGGGFKAPDTDADPPKSLEGFLSNAVSNAGRFINPVNIAEGLGNTLKEGLYDLPKAAIESSGDLLKGTAHAITTGELPSTEDVRNTPILKETEKMAGPIAKDPLGYAYKNPIDAAALLAAPVLPFLGEEGAAEAAGNVPRGTTPPEVPPEVPPETPPPAAPVPPEAPKGLPVVEPGAKTGDPHALFAFNDQMGPGGTPRSIYNVFGDPEHPAVKGIGFGSSVTKADLDKAGIPVTGREPRSVGRWEPLEEAPKTPPNEQAGPGAGGNAPPPPSGASRVESAVDEATKQAEELKNYISKGYEGYAKKPGAIADVADWVQEKSQMMAAQQMGVTPNQARQLGRTPLEAHNAMRAIGQYALDNDIVSPTTGLSGMLEKNASLMKGVGKTLGDYRDMASKLAGEIDPKDIVKEVRQALDKKYMRTVTNAEGEESGPRGAYGGQAGAYMRALQEVEDAEKSHSGIADAATELNHAANKAAKNMQPETPFTDVANEVSRINNEKIKALIGKENAAKYEQALREYGVNKKIANALKFKSSGEVKRFGPGSVMSNLTQKAMDEVGYRLGSKVANKVSTAIKNNPSTAANLPSLFKEFIHQVEDVNHETTGMYKGGSVPDDVKRYVSSRC